MPLNLSLVVLSFLRFEQTTGPCLATLRRALDEPRIELILVDNGSDDGSADHCATWARNHPGTRYLPMPTHLGFAGGMNMGVSVASGEWVCLIDSETLFPPGALDALLNALALAPARVAMLGPVSNVAGNGQCLPLPDMTLQRAFLTGGAAMCTPTGLFTPSYRTDFFCAAIQRNVWHQLGGLDTGSGLDHYEDLDFSLRLRAVGREQAIAEDVFVARLDGARATRPSPEQWVRMRRTRKLLRRRHPQVRFDHVRVGNEHALRFLLGVVRVHGWTPALRERAAWRYAALLRDEDANPIARWRWRWLTRALRGALRAAGIEPRFPSPPNFTLSADLAEDA